MALSKDKIKIFHTLLNDGKVSVKRLEIILFFENSSAILHATTEKRKNIL